MPSVNFDRTSLSRAAWRCRHSRNIRALPLSPEGDTVNFARKRIST
jgi:hypothetical protein